MATVEGGVSNVNIGLTPAENDAISNILQGTFGNASQVAQTQLNGGTFVLGTGSAASNFQQVTSAIVPTAGTGLNNVVVNDNLVQMTVTTPANVVIATQGTAQAVSSSDAANYFQTLIDASVPTTPGDAATNTFRQELTTNTQIAANAVGGEGAVVRVANISTTGAGSDGVVRLGLETVGDAAGSNVVQAVVTGGTAAPIVISGASSAVIIGDGNITTDTSSLIVAGSGNQIVRGSAGADTVIGGGGNDTLFGGAGDTIGFGGLGNYNVVADNTSSLVLDFSHLGVRSLEELASYLTGSTTNADGSVTYNFGSASITLTGISDTQIQFTWATITDLVVG